MFWLINSTITSVVSYTSVLLRLRLYEPKHILIPTHVEVEILQRAHTVRVKTGLCKWTVKDHSFIQNAADTKVWTQSETVSKDTWAKRQITSLTFDRNIFPSSANLYTARMALFTLWQCVFKYKYRSLHVVHWILGRGSLILSVVGSLQFRLNHLEIVILHTEQWQRIHHYTFTPFLPYREEIVIVVKVTLTLIKWFDCQPIFKLVSHQSHPWRECICSENSLEMTVFVCSAPQLHRHCILCEWLNNITY